MYWDPTVQMITYQFQQISYKFCRRFEIDRGRNIPKAAMINIDRQKNKFLRIHFRPVACDDQLLLNIMQTVHATFDVADRCENLFRRYLHFFDAVGRFDYVPVTSTNHLP